MINKSVSFFKELFKETLKTSFVLFKIMIPVTIIVKILQEFGFIVYIGKALFPIMKYVGLPGEMGLVWATGMITNLFGGILAFMSISDGYNLTVGQVTVLTTMMLVAHSLPIELPIARKAGVRLFTMFLIRFTFAFILGALLNLAYTTFGVLNTKSVLQWKQSISSNPTIFEWIISQLKNYAIILCFIFSLLFLIKILKKVGIINLMNKAMNPLLKTMGIGEEATTITIIGLTLGIVYGGALIINESKSDKISKRDVFYSLSLMGLCHSVIEDSILMMSLGGHYSGVLIGRFIFAVLITYLIVKTTSYLNEKTFEKYFVLKTKQ